MLKYGRASDDGAVYRTRSQFIGGIAIAVVANVIALAKVLGNLDKPSTIFIGVLFSAIFSTVGGRLAWSAIVTSPEGIHVANFLSSFDLRWDEIDRFGIGRWKFLPYVCLIHMADGTSRHAFGIEESTQRPDGSAEEIADELNQELMKRRSNEHQDRATSLGSAQSDLFRGSRGR
jgi:hypothetical protein